MKGEKRETSSENGVFRETAKKSVGRNDNDKKQTIVKKWVFRSIRQRGGGKSSSYRVPEKTRINKILMA